MWNEIYQRKEYVYGDQPNDFLKEHAHFLPKGKILCLADGEGRNSVFLAQLGYQVTAVDISEVALAKAHQLAEKNQVNIHFIHADLADFDLGHQDWDGIVSIFCHLPAPLRRQIHSSVIHGLKTQGVYLVEGYTPEQLNYQSGGPPIAEMMLSQALLSKELAQLTPLFLEEKERDIQEGLNHTGLGHVVQGVFCKP
ncbi:methyltransferase domain-containing protein [Vibrio sp. V27_P1S3P104]|uniref:class I SAM-dependent methyltransferase n=1 Tax=unclassified Vibrio TaxID=2614977 RepID=UPI00137318BF|nr:MULTISPECIES: class I SAM-dependent methyltransferase [unclassified Vibrio]NAW69454.1 methyltransferase domain-containing protein [Vibrio sp. V28_P6S34P95]NAX06404.1 methyltransferase domain-containing protein [Vibrio sp. V30_P3S12P165]NAX33373.1 methyltransferase domain-containing protein [Vibrio sp. V29_P1S30P107]NAX36201.1 methyltransferase domain-containing protein [Vibrio sp. V27_P1S3P104]